MRHSALILMLGLAGCAASGDIPGDYRLIAVEGVAVSGSPSLRIEKDGAVSGQGPCNRFSGQNQAKLPALDLGALATTRMACVAEQGEDAFFQALGAVDGALAVAIHVIGFGAEFQHGTQQRHAHGLATTELAGRCLRCQLRQADSLELHLKLLTYVPALG